MLDKQTKLIAAADKWADEMERSAEALWTGDCHAAAAGTVAVAETLRALTKHIARLEVELKRAVHELQGHNIGVPRETLNLVGMQPERD